ncbi:hypothetical protein [Jannaschia donghaensis]|uniref:Outer membrane protein transport protein (OMPP1/FadL/TodX) n=1 Tax=Jannaschia donghaensis TaxID=420998 RepID=A0A0M6YN30_9RHOB|nr:hypothetical protein [Jannaschia donghaensis]CTQ50933.1 Outer membrane protein transport protein (OMPP1/FadL/TodX) [Jannaschia donghaensis]
MNRFTLAVVATIAGAATATAGGLDRSGQGIDILFEEGTLAELSLGFVNPSVSGVDEMPGYLTGAGTPGGNPNFGNGTGNVADSFATGSLAVKQQINERVSFALILDEPYGSDVSYARTGDLVASALPTANPLSAIPVEGSALGGTRAIVDSFAVTALGRYEFGNGFSAHGGLRYQEIEADVSLGGLAYGGLNGYRGEFEADGAFGYVVGVAYERPEIALRVALTYNSKIDHELRTTETLSGQAVTAGTSTTDVRAPESLNLDFQSGVAPKTLVFGSIRYAKYEDLIVSPAFFDLAVNSGELVTGPGGGLVNAPTDGDSLTSVENSIDVEIGVGRQLTDRLAGSVALGWSSSGDDSLVSPLAPTNGSTSIALGASYQVTDAVKLSGGVRYTRLRDADPETGTPDVARASFTDNDVVAVGLKIGYSF